MMFAISANLTFVYSIVLLVWKHRFYAKRNRNTKAKSVGEIYFHPSIMLSFWLVILMMFGFWQDRSSLEIGNTIVDRELGQWIYAAYDINLAWIVVSCYLMVQKEIRYRREVNETES